MIEFVPVPGDEVLRGPSVTQVVRRARVHQVPAPPHSRRGHHASQATELLRPDINCGRSLGYAQTSRGHRPAVHYPREPPSVPPEGGRLP
jgi:hypothetical protein